MSGSGQIAVSPTATEDMSIVQKCEQLEASLAECHAVMEQIEGQGEAKDAVAEAATPGAHGALNRLQGTAQRLLGRLATLRASVGQV